MQENMRQLSWLLFIIQMAVLENHTCSFLQDIEATKYGY